VVKAIRDVGMRLQQIAEVEQVYERGGRPVAAGELPKDDLMRLVKDLEGQMKAAAKDLQFEKAAALRDEVVELRGLLVLEAGPESLEAGAEPVRTTTRVVRAEYRPPGRGGRRR